MACAPNCENIIYAAVYGAGIYRTDITSGAWDDLEPLPYSYSGIVVAREGTLYASAFAMAIETGSDSYIFEDCKGRNSTSIPTASTLS